MVTTAFVGAGVVAMGAGAALPDAKTVGPSALSGLEDVSVASDGAAARAQDAARASRDSERAGLTGSMTQSAPDVWLLPLHNYTFTSPYGLRWGQLHAGVDLAAPEGTPYRAIHAGTVKLAGWNGGYGYCVIVQHDDGTEAVYGHSSKIDVQVGQRVRAGDVLGEVGNTGHSYGSQLYLEIHVDGKPKDPIPWLRDKGVDIKLQLDSIYGDVVNQ